MFKILKKSNGFLRPIRSKSFYFPKVSCRRMGFVPYSQEAFHFGDTVEATDVDEEGVGVKPPTVTRLHIPLADQPELMEKYQTVFGGIRIGRLLEDIDAFGAGIAYKHCDGTDPKRPLTVVTANFDKVELQGDLYPGKSVQLEGQCTYVGKSSMEIRVKVSSIDEKSGKIYPTALDCLMTMVARDPITYRSARVHQLKPTTKEEEQMYNNGKENVIKRRAQSESSLNEKPPNVEEINVIHDLFKLQSNNSISGNWVDLKSTEFSSTMLMHPEHKNIHGKVFGGYLNRQAYDLAYATAHVFFQSRPELVAIDDIHFLFPVNIGCMLNFTSTVVYKESQSVVVEVKARVVEPKRGVWKTTNIFYMIFSTASRDAVADLMPSTYADAMKYLQGRRRMRKR